MRLEGQLVLARYLTSVLGAERFEDLQADLAPRQEGPRGDGHSFYLPVLAGRVGLQLHVDLLTEYDRRVMDYEDRMRRQRGAGFKFKYFQYLSLLCTEILLDRLGREPEALLADLNTYTAALRGDHQMPSDFPDFTTSDLRRLAFFMATGSGKTLLMHVHTWQVAHHLDQARRRDAFFAGDGRTRYDHILLITPGEGLSKQHLEEFAASGIPAVHLLDARRDYGGYRDHLKVVEIHKLVERASGDGVSVELDELGSRNLVLVDEGHKGTGSEAQTWKSRQQALSADGLLLEYSATFAQAVASGNRRNRAALLAEYGKAILFDYSYRYFHGDGFGKDFEVINLANADDDHAHELLVGGLLLFYTQHKAFEDYPDAARVYNVEAPLWVFIGSSVNAVRTVNRQKQSDVATVVAFLRRFLLDEAWATDLIAGYLAGRSGFQDRAGNDAFVGLLSSLAGQATGDLYRAIVSELFGGTGDLEVWAIKGADGEFGLRVSAGGEQRSPYFGLINIGDSSAFKKHLRENLGMEVKNEQFTGSLFPTIDESGSTIRLLIGSKKFIEGWSSWRVSTMGLLNIGRGKGSQVIQLFGRGVRLRGRGGTLKRSAFLEGKHPDWLGPLETLHIFGWNANYIEQFRRVLESEGVSREITVPVRRIEPWPTDLRVPSTPDDYDALRDEVWPLVLEDTIKVRIDRTPKLTRARRDPGDGGLSVDAAAGLVTTIDLSKTGDLFDWRALRFGLATYAVARGYDNVALDAKVLPQVLAHCKLVLPVAQATDPERLQDEALGALRTYLDRFVARRKREAEGSRLAPALLAEDHPVVLEGYRVRATEEALAVRLEDLITDAALWTDGGEPLPRLHFDRHLYNPLLKKDPSISIRPAPLNPGETRVVEDLREWWKENHDRVDLAGTELFLLRNLPRLGVGFYARSGFYPDFILWVRRADGSSRIVFLEPHGMHDEHNGADSEKLKALLDLRARSTQEVFANANIELDGFVLTETPKEDIDNTDGKDWVTLARDHALLLLEPATQTNRTVDREKWVPWAMGFGNGPLVGPPVGATR